MCFSSIPKGILFSISVHSFENKTAQFPSTHKTEAFCIILEVFHRFLSNFEKAILQQHSVYKLILKPSDDQAIYCNKLSRGGGSFGPPIDFQTAAYKRSSFGMEAALD